MRSLSFFVLLMTALAMPAAAAASPARPPVDAPELAQLGKHGVGTLIETIAVAGAEARAVKVRLWYPAVSGGQATNYSHRLERVGAPAVAVNYPALAVANAVPAKGRFPLVVMSHGYRGWPELMSFLGENLASKGYVVAAIDHGDQPFADGPTFARSFGEVIVNRARDQRAVIGFMLGRARGPVQTAWPSIDPARGVGLIGYSMGGFGALATAGAGYDPASPTIKQLPPPFQQVVLSRDAAIPREVRALILIAPWGAQPANRSWTNSGLSNITAPTLMISGDQDDIVDYKQGVRFVFDGLTGSRRRLLVYRDARHNVGGNPLPASPAADFGLVDALAEPVWRSERINAINQHFITAFLDLEMKGDDSRRAYLDVPSPIASNGEWPSAPGQSFGGQTAGDGQPAYWRGFQRRWAVGIEIHSAPASR
ncbi:MAG: dienelactone hydrolase [Pseudomonadota bacterium]|nr:dienelactone hydrolase [Pseudomonadota bacterium]